MEYQKMDSLKKEITAFTSYQKARKSGETAVRLILQNRKLVKLPEEIFDPGGIQYFELDLSYNKTIDFETVITQLSQVDNLRGIALIKNSLKQLPVSFCKLNKLETLNFWNNNLAELPESFKELSNLQYLHLRTNNLKAVPPQLCELTRLRYLSLRNNKIRKLPPEFFRLTKLEHLDISNCGITVIPEEIGLLTELKVLEIAGNNIRKLPASIANLKNLEKIIFKGNKELSLDELFNTIKNLPGYKTLDLREHAIESLPESIGLLQQLEHINLERNLLTNLPAGLGLLTNLQSLHLADNPELSTGDYLKAISGMPAIKKLESYNLSFSGILPDEIGLCQYLEELMISGPLKTISPAIGQLSRLKKLFIYGYADSAIKALPDVFDQLPVLEELYIYELRQLTVFPNSICRSASIKFLTWDTNVDTDFKELNQLTTLEKLACRIHDDHSLTVLAENKYIQHLDIQHFTLEKIPDAFRNMQQLKSFQFYRLPELDIDDAITKLPYLESFQMRNGDSEQLPANLHLLRHLKSFQGGTRLNMSYASAIELVNKCPLLEHLQFTTSELHFPSGIQALNRLNSCEIHYNGSYPYKAVTGEISLDSGLLTIEDLRFSPVYFEPFNRKAELLKKLSNLQLQTDDQKRLAYGLLTGSYHLLKTQLPELCTSPGNLQGKKIFVFGTPTLSSSKELKAMLESKGALVANKLDESVSHILVANNISDKIAPVVLCNKPLILEDSIKEMVFEEEAPYLMAEDNDELTEQVTRLLRDEETDNTNLVLELVGGGGANNRIAAYLLAIHLKHNDNEVRKKARNLFRKYTSASVQNHIKQNWKDSYRDKHYSNHIDKVLPPEFDIFDFILAESMVSFHAGKLRNPGGQHHRVYPHLTLRNYKKNVLPESFKYLDFIEYLQIEPMFTDFDIEGSYAKFSHFNLKSFSCRSEGGRFPAGILNFKNLESISLFAPFGMERYPLQIPSLKENASLKTLSIVGFKLENLENLEPLLFGLREINLSNCNLKHIPNAISRCISLEKLDLRNNPFERLDFNFSLLQKLQKLTLDDCKLDGLPDTFYNCKRLGELSLKNMGLQSVPFSLFTIGKENYSCRLLLQHNQIEDISFNSSLFISENADSVFTNKFETINLSSNKLRMIPGFLSGLKIGTLDLSENPVETIPLDIAGYKVDSLSLSSTLITEIPVELFHATFQISISNRVSSINLPPVEQVPEYTGQKFINNYSEDEDFKKQYEAISKKMITVPYEN